MNTKVFFDTNVLVYAAVGAGSDEAKRQRALDLIESEDFAGVFCHCGEEDRKTAPGCRGFGVD